MLCRLSVLQPEPMSTVRTRMDNGLRLASWAYTTCGILDEEGRSCDSSLRSHLLLCIYCRFQITLSTIRLSEACFKLTRDSYNSSVFEVFASQDFGVTATSAAIDEDALYGGDWKTLNNKDWSRIYATEKVSGYGDLHLLIDQVSFEIQVQQNWSYTLRLSESVENCDWGSTSRQNETFNLEVGFSTDPKLLQIRPTGHTARFVASIEDFTANKTEFPEYALPNTNMLLSDSDENICPCTGWLKSYPALHVKHARAKISKLGTRVQVALPFLSIVIASNVIKVIGIWLAIKTYSKEHLLTGGDAIASFLKTPELMTAGKCTLTQSQRHRYGRESGVKPWTVIRKPTLFVLGGARVWTAIIM